MQLYEKNSLAYIIINNNGNKTILKGSEQQGAKSFQDELRNTKKVDLFIFKSDRLNI